MKDNDWRKEGIPGYLESLEARNVELRDWAKKAIIVLQYIQVIPKTDTISWYDKELTDKFPKVLLSQAKTLGLTEEWDERT